MDLASRRKSQAVAPMMGLIAAKRMSRHWASRIGAGRNSSVIAAPIVKLENSYRLEPKAKFDVKAARDIVQELLAEHLDDAAPYNPRTAVMLTKTLTDSIKNRLKGDMYFDRYRLIVYVTISEKRDQSMVVSSRCIWNDRFDTSVTASHCGKTMACVATVFAVSLE
ncbi:hypothetical protein BOX15_Mlig008023g1 [Macrostomum lignano]|uniref:Tctex1 domain-containing protein 1 n=2 Tax=Macrostomum lignano TaxID=282301 RepID=A0A1I8I2Y7_9PLAT|nr:hypothetical protein BOX15_Mlig008023g1 [Macrostomum lignano]